MNDVVNITPSLIAKQNQKAIESATKLNIFTQQELAALANLVQVLRGK